MFSHVIRDGLLFGSYVPVCEEISHSIFSHVIGDELLFGHVNLCVGEFHIEYCKVLLRTGVERNSRCTHK